MRDLLHNILAGVLVFAGIVLLFGLADWLAAQPFTAPTVFVLIIGACVYALVRIGKWANR